MTRNSNDDKAPTGRVTLGPLAEDISFMSRVLRAQIRGETNAFLEKHQVRGGEIVVLNLINHNPGISQNDLAAAVVLKKSAVTQLVNQLEEAGLIERRKGAGDRRVNQLHLTQAGEARRAALLAPMQAQQERLLAPLDAAERARLFELMGRLVDHLAGRPG